MIIQGKKSATREIADASISPTGKSAIPAAPFKEYLSKDPVLASNLRQLQDAIFEKYPRVDGKNQKVVDERNKQLKDANFGQTFKDSFPALWHNGTMFNEVDVAGKKLTGFYMIDSDTMKVKESKNGTLLEVIQRQTTGDKVINKDKIMHIKAPSLKTGTLGEAMLTPLSYVLARKQKAEDYLSGMIENLHPLLALNIEGNDDTQIKDIQNALRAKRNPLDPLKVITILPDEKVQRVDTGTTSNFTAIQEYINEQNAEIIRIVQIPPIVAGTTDNSNRSNSEIQDRSVFGRTVASWQNFFASHLDRLFEEKLGWKDTHFEFPVEDDRKQEAAFVRANKLKELMYSKEAIHEYLVEQGVKIKKEFEEPEEKVASSDLSGFDSRKPRDKTGIPQNEEKRKADVKNGTKKESQ